MILRMTLLIGCSALLGGAGLLVASENMPTKASGAILAGNVQIGEPY